MLRVCCLLFCSILAFVVPSAAQTHEPCLALPMLVQRLLDRRFPNLRAKTTSDLTGYDKKLWEETHPRECPGIAAGHFESPNGIAYAVLLIPKSEPISSYRMVVVSGDSGKYVVRVLDHAEAGSFADSG
jgi:hypothetical protein